MCLRASAARGYDAASRRPSGGCTTKYGYCDWEHAYAMKALVGLSGGVDSSAAILILREAGHEVVGATMKLWRDGKYKGGARDACFGPGEKDDIAYARSFCAARNIPYEVVDCSAAYEETIVSEFRREYLAGRTPNPCVRCNAQMKFGLLPREARRMGIEFDVFATGHYARLGEKDGVMRLRRAADLKKDQSYFLYRLARAQLDKICFPLGEMTKAEVRAKAAQFGLAVADKPDSQDFYSGDASELLEVAPRPGKIVDMSGNVVGTHAGYWNYTIGQRRGLGVSSKTPLYVVKINACRNTVVVSDRCPEDHYFEAADLNWHIEDMPREFDAQVKVRSAQDPVPCHVCLSADGETVSAEIPEGIAAISPGQSAVFYDGEWVIGGGIIAKACETRC